MFTNRVILRDKEELAEAFAAYLVQRIRAKKGAFHLCLSGGSTPALTFEILASEYRTAIPGMRSFGIGVTNAAYLRKILRAIMA